MTRLLAAALVALVSSDVAVVSTATPVHPTASTRPAGAAARAAGSLRVAANARSRTLIDEIRRATRSRFRPTPVHRSMSSTRSSRPAAVVELLDVTAYCATGSRTASGGWPHAGQAAGNRWPFGTRLRVPGVGVVTITDRIGWGSDLDLYFGDRADCAAAAGAWGRRRLAVEVVR